jgi:hypothetical protein
MKKSARNLLGLVFVIVSAIAYLKIFGDRIPASYAIQVNFLLVPFLLGTVSFFVLEGPIWLKLILLLAVPVVHVAYFGSDDAKPGLENVVAAIEYASLCLGVVLVTLYRRWRARTSVSI